MNEALSIFLIDDHRLFSQSFQAYISTQKEFTWKGSSDGTGRTINDILQLNPKVVLMDFHLKEVNGLELLKQLRSAGYKGFIVMLTMNRETQIQMASKTYGANGFVNKDADSEELLQGIKQLVGNEIGFLDITQFKKEEDVNPYQLTKKEKQIAELVCSGMNSESIGEKLKISIHTVHTHRRRILEKTASSTFLEVCHKIS